MTESLPEDDASSPERVARLGEELRAARIAHSMEMSDVAQRLNLELYVVEGLEQDNYEGLPEPAYIRGYLLAYLRLLDLPLSLLETFDQQFPLDGPLATSPGLSTRSACSNDGWVRCISTGLIALLVIVVILWVLEESFHILQPEAEPVAQEQAEPFAEEEEPIAIDEVVLPPLDDIDTGLPLPTDEQVDVASEQIAGDSASQSAGDGAAVTVAEVSGDQPATDSVAETEAVAALDPESPLVPRLEMKFLDASWVQVDDSTGSKLKAGTFNKGDSFVIDHEGELRLVIGRSQNVQLTYAGEAVDLSRYKAGVARLVLGTPPE